VGIALGVSRLPESGDALRGRAKPELAVATAVVEVLREPPSGIDRGQCAQSAPGRRGVLALEPRGIGRQGRAQALEEYRIVRRGPGGGAEGRDSLDEIRVADSPLERLLRAHGVADDQGQAPDPEPLGEESMLRGDVVTDGDRRKPRPVEWRRSVAR